MNYTIVSSYTQTKRWSAYDTDEFHCVEVIDEKGKRFSFENMKPITSTQIIEKITRYYYEVNKEQRKKELINLKREGKLQAAEAFELLDMLVK